MSFKRGYKFGRLFAQLELILFLVISKLEADSVWAAAAETFMVRLESLKSHVTRNGQPLHFYQAYETLKAIDNECDALLEDLQECGVDIF